MLPNGPNSVADERLQCAAAVGIKSFSGLWSLTHHDRDTLPGLENFLKPPPGSVRRTGHRNRITGQVFDSIHASGTKII